MDVDILYIFLLKIIQKKTPSRFSVYLQQIINPDNFLKTKIHEIIMKLSVNTTPHVKKPPNSLFQGYFTYSFKYPLLIPIKELDSF